MTQRITAVFEQGHLRPTTPLDLAEGTEVQIVIESVAQPPHKPRRSPEEVRKIIAEIAAMPEEGGPDGRTPAEILAAISAQPMEPGGREFSNRDHDRILYGEDGAQ
jgi:predicted DNA-binding antitoxin AbrB/MazE fold protein